MKPDVSAPRQLDIAFFSTTVQRAGAILVPNGSDAERIRRIAEYLGLHFPPPRNGGTGKTRQGGASARALLAQLETLILP